MAEKIEHRLDEYRECENGTWGPWQKLDGRLFDGDVASAAGPEEYAIYEKWCFGKIESKDAWAKLKKLWTIYYEWANDTNLNKPGRRHIAMAYQTKYEKIEIYLKEIGDRIIQDQQPAITAVRREASADMEARREEPPKEADQVFLFYPEFKRDYQWLEEENFLERNGDRLKWLKSKQSLSEYFGCQKKAKGRNVEWKFIEALFEVTGLKNSFSKNGNSYGKNHSKDYEKLLEIKNAR
jgi:hypothetical protein